MNPFQEKEEKFKALQAKLDEDDKFDAFTKALKDLKVEFQGHLWRLGVAGVWEKQEGKAWVIATPPGTPTSSGRPSESPTDNTPAEEEPVAETTEVPDDSPPIDADATQKLKAPHTTHPITDAAAQGSEEETLVREQPAREKTAASPATNGTATVLSAKETSQPIWLKPVIITGGLIILLLLCALTALAGNLYNRGISTPTAITQAEASPTKVLAAVATFTKTAAPATPTVAATNTPVATDTPTITPAPSDTATGTPVPVVTATNTPTVTPSPTATAVPTDSPTATATATTLQPSPTPTPVVSVLPTVTPSPTPNINGILAYPVFDVERKTYDIQIIDLATKQLLREIKNASQPDISPNGKQIVYRNWQLDKRGLFVEDLLTGDNWWQASYLLEASRPIWNSTSDRIVYASNHINSQQWDIFFPVDDPEGGGGQNPAWFKNGRLTYQGSSGTNDGLMIGGSTSPVFLTHSPEDKFPAPSPDESRVAFTSKQGNQWDLYLVEVSSGQRTALTNDAAYETSPIWSPDGQRIAFVSNRGGSWAIWTITPNGEDAKILLSLPGSIDGEIKDIPAANQTGWMLEHISWVNQEEQ